MDEAPDPFFRLLGWSALIHDDGWFIADRGNVIRFEGRAPNSGYRRPWWRRASPTSAEGAGNEAEDVMPPRPVPCARCRFRREKVVGSKGESTTFHVCDWWTEKRGDLPIAGYWFVPTEMARAANDIQVNGPTEGEMRDCACFEPVAPSTRRDEGEG